MRSEVLLIVLGTRTNCLSRENCPLITNAIHQTALSIVIAHHCCQLHTKFNLPSSVTVNCIMKMNRRGSTFSIFPIKPTIELVWRCFVILIEFGIHITLFKLIRSVYMAVLVQFK